MKVKGKTAARNNILKKLSNTKWGTSPSTIKTTALALSYSTAEYACPVWERSTHAEKIDPVLNEACRLITGCLKPTKVESLYQLAGIAPPTIRRSTISQREREKQTTDNRHSLYGHIAPTKRLKSRKSFVHSVQPITCSPSENRLSAWTNHLQSTPTQLNITPSESLATGSSLPWCEWQCLNRLRTRVGRCKYNMNKWGYCDDDTTCDCTEEPQTMEHLLNCPLLPQACTTDDLLIYNDTAQRCVKQWMTKV